MGHIKLANDNAILADFGLARVDLFIWCPLDVDNSARHASPFDVDSGIQPISSYPSGYFSADYVADPNRSQVAAEMDGSVTYMSHDANLFDEDDWLDGSTRGSIVRCHTGSRGQLFYSHQRV